MTHSRIDVIPDSHRALLDGPIIANDPDAHIDQLAKLYLGQEQVPVRSVRLIGRARCTKSGRHGHNPAPG